MTRTAYLAVPPVAEHYPYAALRLGLKRVGYQISDNWQTADMLLSWSTWLGSHRHTVAEYFRRDGRPIVIAENGWLSPIRGRAFYQLAFDGWNGTGRFCSGDSLRWDKWCVEMKPWRADPLGYSLVIGQRGHPLDRRTAEPGWHTRVPVEALRVRRRDRDCAIPLDADLAGARECHVWTSNAASWAVLSGVPVIQHGPNLAVSELASRDPEIYAMPDRLPVLRRLAWMQWCEAELRTGEAFAWLLGEAVA